MAGREYVAKTLVGPEHTPLLEVRKLAVAEGVDDMQLRIAMESIDVRAPAGACSAFFPSRLSTMHLRPVQRWNAVVDLIVRKKFHGWGPPHEPANLAALPKAAPGAEEDTRDPWIRQSLTLSMSALRRLATAARVAGEVVDAALDSPNPKEEIVKHVMLRIQALREMKVSELRKMATAEPPEGAAATRDAVEDAMDQARPKEFLIAMILDPPWALGAMATPPNRANVSPASGLKTEPVVAATSSLTASVSGSLPRS